MRFHKQRCEICETETLFLEKLVNVQSDTCTEMEDICQKCKTPFFVKEKNELKLNCRI